MFHSGCRERQEYNIGDNRHWEPADATTRDAAIKSHGSCFTRACFARGAGDGNNGTSLASGTGNGTGSGTECLMLQQLELIVAADGNAEFLGAGHFGAVRL